MKSVTVLIGAVIVILLMAAVMVSVTDFRTDSFQDTFDVTTGGGETTAPVVLSQDLFNDATYNVSAISSNLTADTPAAASYVTATNTLTVSGLDADLTRRLTVTYRIDGLEDYIGAGVAAGLWPLLIILGVIAIVAGAMYNAFKSGD